MASLNNDNEGTHHRSRLARSSSSYQADEARGGKLSPDSSHSSSPPPPKNWGSQSPVRSVASSRGSRSSSPDRHRRRRRRRKRRPEAEVEYGSDSSRLSDRSPRRDRHARRHSSPDWPDLTNPGHPAAGGEKPWFKKKTLWAGVATVATVLALLPASVSAKGSREAAHASEKAAEASKRSANAVEKSANAVVKSSIAQGHMDEKGRYNGPKENLSDPKSLRGRAEGRGQGRGQGRHQGRNQDQTRGRYPGSGR